MTENNTEKPVKKLSPLQLVGSILSGAIGVQSSKNRERDFGVNSIVPFIIGGLLFTTLFVGGIITAVNVLVK